MLHDASCEWSQCVSSIGKQYSPRVPLKEGNSKSVLSILDLEIPGKGYCKLELTWGHIVNILSMYSIARQSLQHKKCNNWPYLLLLLSLCPMLVWTICLLSACFFFLCVTYILSEKASIYKWLDDPPPFKYVFISWNNDHFFLLCKASVP